MSPHLLVFFPVSPSKACETDSAVPVSTEKELVALMEEFVVDVREGKHQEKGWDSFYGISKVGVTAMTKVFAREVAQSGNDISYTLYKSYICSKV